MGKFIIALYTGTGNTLYVAKQFKNAEIHFISEFLSGQYVLLDDTETLGIMFPVYNQSYPYPVALFVKQVLSKRDNSALQYIFAINTSSGHSLGANYMLEKLLMDSGVALSYSTSLKFPSADLKKHHKSLSEMKTLAEVNKRALRIEKTINDIENKEIKISKYIPFSYIKELISNRTNKPKKVTDLAVSDKCTACEICYKICPTDNITIDNGKATFKDACIKCYACYHRCPEKAIIYKKKTTGQYIGLVDTKELFRR